MDKNISSLSDLKNKTKACFSCVKSEQIILIVFEKQLSLVEFNGWEFQTKNFASKSRAALFLNTKKTIVDFGAKGFLFMEIKVGRRLDFLVCPNGPCFPLLSKKSLKFQVGQEFENGKVVKIYFELITNLDLIKIILKEETACYEATSRLLPEG